MLYLIEGLDCSGKKAVAIQVQKMLQDAGYTTNIIIGSCGSKFVQKLDGLLVHSYNIQKGSIKDKFRKFIYAIEPVIDGLLYHNNINEINIKVSSHYRAWARAVVENDKTMIIFYLKSKKVHIKYDGGVLLTADFNTRIERHRLDVKTGKTDKIESKRFFNYNKKYFDNWNQELQKLIAENISLQLPIDTTNVPIEIIANEVYNRILEVRKALTQHYIIMLKPDALGTFTNKESAHDLYIEFANHLLQLYKFPTSDKTRQIAIEAHRHVVERAESEKAFMGDTKIVSMNEINNLLSYAVHWENQKDILVENVIIKGLLLLGFRIISDSYIKLSIDDVNNIYITDQMENDNPEISLRLHEYLDNKKVRVIKLRGKYAGFLLQHWKTYVRHFLIVNKKEKYPLRNLIHVCDGTDFDYINQLIK